MQNIRENRREEERPRKRELRQNIREERQEFGAGQPENGGQTFVTDVAASFRLLEVLTASTDHIFVF